ncbi:MAG: CocE/NonD family hydrolase [Gammaproteobacteria bacterium]
MKAWIHSILRWWVVGLAIAVAPATALAQDFDFRPPASALDPSVPAVMRDLAQRILPVYQENDQDRYLSNLSALQMVAGDPVSAYATRQALMERHRGAKPVGRALVYDIYVRARAIEAQVRVPFAKAYPQAFRDAVNRIDDLDAYQLEAWLSTPLPGLQDGVQRAFDQRRAKGSVSLNDAIDLIWAWFAFEGYRSFTSLVRPLAAAEDQRRYATEEAVVIGVSKKATVTASLVRPQLDTGKLPALLEFTLDPGAHDAREAAAHGYVSVLAHPRGQGDKDTPFTPFQSDGDDARAVIEWIAKQPWSNGRVGMQGSGYGGYVAWAAAKRVPPALKAIVTSDPMAPGIDLPMSGGIFLNSAYRWVYGVTAEPDDKVAGDDARWRALDDDWYKSGRRYREYPTLPGQGSVLFRRWLSHPSYDRFWQKLVPFREEFAHVNIPVLTMTGYYSAGQTAALYYFNQHRQYNAKANHALLIGPYDELGAQRGPSPAVHGLALDPAAVIELHDVRYEWFDYALKGAKRPAMVSSHVNYQLAGANEWRHGSTVDGLDKKPLRFYLEAAPDGDQNRLVATRSETLTFLPQFYDLADRSDVSWRPSPDLVVRGLKARNGELFFSEPLSQATDVAGLFRGQLDFVVNRVDMDLRVALYELRPTGEYIKLFDPAYAFRTSYAKDRVNRKLLRAGERQQFSFKSEKMLARRVQAGSRLVMSLEVNKRADQQVNYGTGDDVSEESVEDANSKLRIRWYNSSYIEIPAQ